jgi:hypothetical protein
MTPPTPPTSWPVAASTLNLVMNQKFIKPQLIDPAVLFDALEKLPRDDLEYAQSTPEEREKLLLDCDFSKDIAYKCARMERRPLPIPKTSVEFIFFKCKSCSSGSIARVCDLMDYSCLNCTK